MGDVQQQIADGAQPRARVGDVIEHGEAIPANVVRLNDHEGDPWIPDEDEPGTWRGVWSEAIRAGTHRRYALTDGSLAPFTVVEVDPEPQPAEAVDLLSLVKRWGDQMYKLGAANTAGGDAERARQVSEAAGALMRQIRATPLPAAPGMVADGCSWCRAHGYTPGQQLTHEGVPVEDEPGPLDREPDEREVADTHLMMTLGVDRLDGVIPAIESLLADRKTLMLVESELGTDRPEDVLSTLEKRFNALVLARRSRDENRQERLRAEAEVERLSARLGEARAALAATREQRDKALDAVRAMQQPAAPGPLVLTLPEVPAEAVALVGGSSGATYPRTGAAWAYDQSPTGVIALGELLDIEGSVTVEFAPPPEPRTWPKLDPVPADVLRVRGASGSIWKRRATEGAWHNEDYSKVRSWGALALEDGPLTEVPL